MQQHIKLETYVSIVACKYKNKISNTYRTEREKYAKHRHKSEKNPSRYLSIIIDGMDQEKTSIPHIISNPKVMAGAATLETHVTGAKAHGHCSLMAIDCGQFPHDSNLTIEVLLRLLQEIKVKSVK